MPTNKPRVMVTLSHNVHATIARMAEIQGVSKSSIIADLMEAVHPPLMRTVAMLEAARDAPDEVKRGLVQTLEALERQMGATAALSDEQLDWVATSLRAGSTPGTVIRGSGSSGKSPGKGKNPSKSGGKRHG